MGSGTTLVDLVAGIWGLASATINAVKSAATTVLNGIKAVGQFITDAVIGAIVDSFAYGMEMMFRAIASFISIGISGVSTSFSDGTINFNIDGTQLPISIQAINTRIRISVAGANFEIGLFDNFYSYETLGSGLDDAKFDLDFIQINLLISLITMAITMISIKVPHPFTVIPAVASLWTSIFSNVAYLYGMVEGVNRLDSYTQTEKDEYGDAMIKANILIAKFLGVVPLATGIANLANLGLDGLKKLFTGGGIDKLKGMKSLMPIATLTSIFVILFSIIGDGNPLEEVGIGEYFNTLISFILLPSVVDGLLGLYLFGEIGLKIVSTILSIYSVIHAVFGNIISVKLGRGLAEWTLKNFSLKLQ